MNAKEINNRQIEAVAKAIQNLQEHEIIELHNDSNKYGDNNIYPMDWLDLDIFSECKDIDICDDYVVAAIYGWKSGNFTDMEQYIEYDEIAENTLIGKYRGYNYEITHDIEDDFVNLCKEIDEDFAKYVEDNVPVDLVRETWSDIINELAEEYKEEIK